MGISTFALTNGIKPFSGDDADTFLTQAYSLLSVMGAAWVDASAAQGPELNGHSEFFAHTGGMMTSAFDGIATLVALGAYVGQLPKEGH